MPFHKPTCQLVATICSVFLFAVTAYADDLPATGTNLPPKLEVTVYKAEIQRAVITVGTNQFLINIPNGLRMDPSKPDKIVLVPDDYSYFLIFRIIDPAVAGSDASKADSYRGLALSEYPGAKIVDEFSVSVAGRTGVEFILQWKPSGVSERVVRVAFAPSRAGVLQLSMVADTKNNSEAEFSFKGFLRSFRSNENGKIEIIQSPGNS